MWPYSNIDYSDEGPSPTFPWLDIAFMQIIVESNFRAHVGGHFSLTDHILHIDFTLDEGSSPTSPWLAISYTRITLDDGALPTFPWLASCLVAILNTLISLDEGLSILADCSIKYGPLLLGYRWRMVKLLGMSPLQSEVRNPYPCTYSM